MMEDIRNHDATPTEEELRWMQIDPVYAVLGLVAVAALALAISVSASSLV